MNLSVLIYPPLNKIPYHKNESYTARSKKVTPMKIPPEIRSLIEPGIPANYVTLNPDGSPQITCVWIGDPVTVTSAH